MGNVVTTPTRGAFRHANDAARAAVKRNRSARLNYFAPATLAWWDSKVYEGFDDPTGATYLVMSNRDTWGLTLNGVRTFVVDGRRHYFVVRVEADGRTRNVSHPDGHTDGVFGWFRRDQARTFAKACAAMALDGDQVSA